MSCIDIQQEINFRTNYSFKLQTSQIVHFQTGPVIKTAENHK